MPAAGTYAAPERNERNEYLVQPRLTLDGLLAAFYEPVLELARLMQATQVPHDLDPTEIARSKALGADRWRWSVSLPMQVEKLWARLQAVREQLQRALERAPDEQARRRLRAQPADADLVRGCMHLRTNLENFVLHVSPQLAGWFVHRQLVFVENLQRQGQGRMSHQRQLPSLPAHSVLSDDAAVAQRIRKAWELGAFQHALALYFRAQITDALARLAPALD